MNQQKTLKPKKQGKRQRKAVPVTTSLLSSYEEQNMPAEGAKLVFSVVTSCV